MTQASSGVHLLTWMVKERLDSTGGRPGRYEAVTFSYVIVPEAGQPAGAAPPPCFTVGGSCNQLSQSDTECTHDRRGTPAHKQTILSHHQGAIVTPAAFSRKIPREYETAFQQQPACSNQADDDLVQINASLATTEWMHLSGEMAGRYLRQFGVLQHALYRRHVILCFCSLPDGPLHHATHVQHMGQGQTHQPG